MQGPIDADHMVGKRRAGRQGISDRDDHPPPRGEMMHNGTENPARIAPTPAPAVDIDEAGGRRGVVTAGLVDVESQAGAVFDFGDSFDA